MTNASAFVGGCIFGLSGFFMARTFAGHVDVIAAASWMPWVVWAFWRLGSEQNFIDSPHRFVIASAVFALQLLSGYQTMAFFTVIAVGIFALLESITQKVFALYSLLFTLYSWASVLPLFKFFPTAEFLGRASGHFNFPTAGIRMGRTNGGVYGNLYILFCSGINIRIPVRLLILWSIVHLSEWGVDFSIDRTHKSDKTYATNRGSIYCDYLFGIWVSLGPNAPIDLQKVLWQIVPMYHYLRIPPRHLILVVFGLAGLAGIGFDRLPKSLRVLRSLIAGVIVVEMVVFARSFIELKPIPEARHDSELILLLTKDPQPYRLLQNFGAWLPQRDGLDFDGVMAYGIQSATGYDPSILRSYYEFVALASGKSGEAAVLDADVQVPYLSADSASAIDRLNIKYLMVPIAYDPFANNSRYTLRREDTKKEYRLYENTTVFPRFYFSKKSAVRQT